MKKNKALKDEELEKVTGGLVDNNDAMKSLAETYKDNIICSKTTKRIPAEQGILLKIEDHKTATVAKGKKIEELEKHIQQRTYDADNLKLGGK